MRQTETHDQVPESVELVEDKALTPEIVESVPGQLEERASVRVLEFKQRGAGSAEVANPSEQSDLASLEGAVHAVEQQLYKKLEAARVRLQSAREASAKVKFWDRSAMREAKADVEEATEDYQSLMTEHQDSRAAQLIQRREQRVQAERDNRQRKSLFSRVGQRLTKDAGRVLSEDAQAQERLTNVTEQYDEAAAEVVADHISLALQEMGALADQRAIAEHAETNAIYQAYKSLSEMNLQAVLKSLGTDWEPSSWRGRLAAKGLNARLLVNLSLVGGGLVAGATGFGAAAGGLLVTKRLLSGLASGSGTFDLAGMLRQRKLNKEVAKRLDKESPANLSTEDLNNYIAQLESAAIVNGRRPTMDRMYQRLQSERGRRWSADHQSEGLAPPEKAADAMQQELASMMQDADKRFLDFERGDRDAQARFKVYGAAVGVLIGSGEHVRLLKGLVGTAYAAEPGADAFIAALEAGSLPDGFTIDGAQAALKHLVEISSTTSLGDMKMLLVDGGTIVQNGDTLGFQMATGELISLDSPEAFARVPQLSELLSAADSLETPAELAEVPLSTDVQPPAVDVVHSVPAGDVRVGDITELTADKISGADTVHFTVDGTGVTLDYKDGVYEFVRDNANARGIRPGVVVDGFDRLAKAHAGRADSSFVFGTSVRLSRYSDMLKVIEQMREAGLADTPQFASLQTQIAAESASITHDYGNVLVSPIIAPEAPAASAIPDKLPGTSTATASTDLRGSDLAHDSLDSTPVPTSHFDTATGGFTMTQGAEGYTFTFPDPSTHFSPGLARDDFIDIAKAHAEKGSSGFVIGTQMSFGRLEQLLQANQALESAGLANQPQQVALAAEIQSHINSMAREYGNVFNSDLMGHPGMPDTVRTPNFAALAYEKLPDLTGARAVERAADWQESGKTPSGLFDDEWDRATKRAISPVTPGKVVDGFARGVRGTDDSLNRTLDVGAYKAQDWVDDNIAPNTDPTAQLPVDQETLPGWRPEDAPSARKAAKAAMQADRQTAHQEVVESAREIAELEDQVFKIPEHINPETVAQFEATGTLHSGDTTAVFEHIRGKRFSVTLTEMPDQESAVTSYLGDDYREVIRRNLHLHTIHDARPMIVEVEGHTRKLAGLLEIKKTMIENGLTKTPQFRVLDKAIDQTQRDVTQYGRVMWDDPGYGKMSAQQIRSLFISTGTGSPPSRR